MRRHAFSLIELVIAVVIIGIIAAIAIPRLSRASAAAADSTLSGDLAVLRKAIEMYTAEHDGQLPVAKFFVDQLTRHSNSTGDDFIDKTDAWHPFGPYIRSIPPLSVGLHRGDSGVDAGDGTGIGWIYDETTGDIRANASSGDPADQDARGVPYDKY
jgi:prepilin-type N-terminal cleavage/methylation domain-containing protein